MGAHSQVKHVLSALKAEKIKGEVRLVHTIKRIKNTRFAAHLRALWTSRLNKYKVARAKLYKQLMHKNMLLAKEIKLTGKKMEQQSGQTKRRTRMEIDRKHAIGYMKARIERYAAHLKEQRLEILKRKKNNDASTQQFEERKAKTLRRFKRERVGGAINAEKLREESLAHARGLKNKENEITMSVLRKRRLREVMTGEVARKKKISTQMRIAQKRSERYMLHGHEQLKEIKEMQNDLWRLRRREGAKGEAKASHESSSKAGQNNHCKKNIGQASAGRKCQSGCSTEEE